MEKSVTENLKRLAEKIWVYGELKNAEGCLKPFMPNFNDHDDPIIDTYDVTHYDYQWKERGKYVTINLYKADCFGACINTGELKHSFIVEL